MAKVVFHHSDMSAVMRQDEDYNEFAQFQQFKALLKMANAGNNTTNGATNGSATYPNVTGSGSASSSSNFIPHPTAHIIPAHLGNPSFVYQDEVNGYLSKQFPTIGNPAPLGLCGFALTTFVLSMYNVGASVATSGPNGAVMGLALFYGGLIQLLAGMWELRVGNTFGATAFASYGGFWMSFAALNMKEFGFTDGYGVVSAEYVGHAIGIYLFAWCLFSLLMTVASHRTTVVLVTLFFTVALTFLLLAIGAWANSVNSTQAGGAFGILAAAIAWYAALAGLLTKSNSAFTLPVWDLSGGAGPAQAEAQAKAAAVEMNSV